MLQMGGLLERKEPKAGRESPRFYSWLCSSSLHDLEHDFEHEVCPVRGWAQSAWTAGDSNHNLPPSPAGPPLSLFRFISAFASAQEGGWAQEENSSLQIPLCLGTASSMPKLSAVQPGIPREASPSEGI